MPSTSNNKNKKIVSEEKFETSIEESDVSGSEGDYVSWVSWYCNLKGHEFFCEVDDDYIQDDFNLCGLSGQVPYYDYALDLILDVESSHGDKLNEEQDSLVESSAEMLYGLIHARYILTSKGMSAMLEKYTNNEFGTCPRAYCCEQPCLPVGQSDIPRASYVRIYCPKCEDIYLPRTRYQYEEEKDPTRVPTKHNIRTAMYWLVQGCQPGDSLVFHFSGHGSQQRNYNGDELDGFDETICPLDFETQGMIVDDEINATLVKPLPHGVKLHAIIDACHSGTVLDLPYLCRMDRTGRYVWEDHRPQSGAWKGTNGGEVISFSGCDDDQTSADTNALSKVTSTGAMTFSFIQAIERGHGIITYGDMLTAMRSTIRKTDNDLGGGSVVTSLLTMLLTGGILGEGMRQEPQLTANEPFDVYKKVFSI